MTKTCSACCETLPATAEFFYKNSVAPGGFASRCRVCLQIVSKIRRHFDGDKRRAYQRQYCAENRERLLRVRHERYYAERDRWRGYMFKSLYGMTLEGYRERLAGQDGKCAICGGVETAMYLGRLRWMQVDHDHETGRVRGILCGPCNRILAQSREDVVRLHKAIEYLERHSVKV